MRELGELLWRMNNMKQKPSLLEVREKLTKHKCNITKCIQKVNFRLFLKCFETKNGSPSNRGD